MEKHIQKISHKYEFLKLELEERQEVLDEYLVKWNSIVGKYFLDKQKVMYIDEETGEIRQDIPEKDSESPAAPKLKKLYRKLSTYAHPDKGGNTKDFAELKSASCLLCFFSKIFRQFTMSKDVSANVPSKSKSIASILLLIIYFFTMYYVIYIKIIRLVKFITE